jgi:hypothetical protein
MQFADTPVNHTCRKKPLRYYFSGQEMSTVFSASLKVNDWYSALLKIRLLKICSDVVVPDVRDDS